MLVASAPPRRLATTSFYIWCMAATCLVEARRWLQGAMALATGATAAHGQPASFEKGRRHGPAKAAYVADTVDSRVGSTPGEVQKCDPGKSKRAGTVNSNRERRARLVESAMGCGRARARHSRFRVFASRPYGYMRYGGVCRASTVLGAECPCTALKYVLARSAVVGRGFRCCVGCGRYSEN